jgi:hypothetical protein
VRRVRGFTGRYRIVNPCCDGQHRATSDGVRPR